MKKTILVLGGGIGGIRTAREINKIIGNDEDATLAKILVFEKEKASLFAPSLTWMMVGKREMYQIQDDLSKIELGGIEVVYGEIESVDPENISVVSNGKSYKGDYMVVSLGTEQADYKGLSQTGHNFYTSEGAKNFHNELVGFKQGNIAIVVSSMPFKSPVAPYEASMLVDSYLRENGIREHSNITLFSPETTPMSFAGEQVSEKIIKLMESKGISYRPGHELVAAEPGKLTFNSNGDTSEASFDLVGYTPHHECPAVIKEAGLVGSSGWVEVDEKTLSTKFKNVYAIGDITNIQLSEDESLPKAGVFAQYQASVVAHNIVKNIHGKEADREFEAKGEYILEHGEGRASGIGGNFYSADLEIKESSAIRHWVKILQEKSWFAKHF